MSKRKILTIIGARPQFIKAAAVSRVLAQNKNFQELIVHTGQHYDASMSDTFFTELEIPKPKYNLGVGSASHGEQTAKMLSSIEGILKEENPSCVLVYGDTNSTLAGALAASKLHFKIAHVEAGLRSFNKKMPEELNRILTDHCSDFLFTPTETAKTNLLREGFKEEVIHQVGDVMFDASLYFLKRAEKQSKILSDLQLQPQSFVLSTIHRAENTDNPQILKNIFNQLTEVAQRTKVVLPLHPRTRKIIAGFDEHSKWESAIKIIDPVGYLDMVMLEKNACLIATDSGGIQKEAYFFNVPCVTLRNETEWVELVEMGVNTLVNPNQTTIAKEIFRLIEQNKNSKLAASSLSPYGDGHASEKILNVLSAGLS